jgi:hypothetical protein
MNYETIELYGVRLTLHYTVEGMNIPATRDEPEETPEATIHKITAEDSEIDLTNVLQEHIEEVYQLLNEKL